MPPSTRSLRSRIASTRQGPRIVELAHSPACNDGETTYLGDSFMNGAPGVFLGGPARPCRGDLLVGAAPQQDRRARSPSGPGSAPPTIGLTTGLPVPARDA